MVVSISTVDASFLKYQCYLAVYVDCNLDGHRHGYGWDYCANANHLFDRRKTSLRVSSLVQAHAYCHFKINKDTQIPLLASCFEY